MWRGMLKLNPTSRGTTSQRYCTNSPAWPRNLCKDHLHLLPPPQTEPLLQDASVAKFSIIRPARDEEFMIAAVGDGIPTRLKKSLIPDDAMRAWKACGRRPRTFHIDRASEPTVKGGSDVVEIAGMTTAHQAVYSNMQLPLPSEMSHCPEVVTLDDDTALPAPATKRQRTAPPLAIATWWYGQG